MEQKNEELEIDLMALFYHLKKKLWIIVASFLVCAVVGFTVSQFFMTPEYTASTRMYVLNRSNEENVVSADYQISNYMISDYTVLITGRNVTQAVIAELGLGMDDEELAEMLEVTSPDDTRVLQISVTDTDPQRAANIANSVREIASRQIKEIMDVDAVNLIYTAEAPEEPSAPSVMKNTVLAAALGLVASIAVLTVVFVCDDTIRTEEDVERYLGLGVMGVIPVSAEMESAFTNTSANKRSSTWKVRKTGKK